MPVTLEQLSSSSPPVAKPLTAEQLALITPPTFANDTPPEVLDGLKEAITSDDEDAFSKLLMSYVNSERCTEVQHLALVLTLAVEQDKPYYITRLLESGIKMHHSFPIEAINARAKRSLETLLEFGWDINDTMTKTDPGILQKAFHDEEMTFWMLDHGADLNKQAYLDITPMSIAISDASPDLIKQLLDKGADVTKGELLHYVFMRNTDVPRVFSLLLDKGAPINAIKYANHPTSSNHYFWMDLGTPLHVAARRGMVDIVQLLLDNGADATLKSSHGRTAQEFAERKGHAHVVRLLTLQMERI